MLLLSLFYLPHFMDKLRASCDMKGFKFVCLDGKGKILRYF